MKQIHLFLLSLFLSASTAAFAVSKTFIGVASGGVAPSWTVAGNWNPAGVPADADDVTIPAGASVQLDAPTNRLGATTIAGTLTVFLSGGAISFNNAGALTLLPDGKMRMGSNTTLNNNSGGTMLIDGNGNANTFINVLEAINNNVGAVITVSNYAWIGINSNATMVNSGTIHNNSGDIYNAGNFTNSGTMTNNGLYEGTGTFTSTTGAFVNEAGGTIGYPFTLDCMRFETGFTNKGLMSFDIAGSTPCSNADNMTVTGNTILGGTFEVLGSPIVGTTVAVLTTTGNLTGSFANSSYQLNSGNYANVYYDRASAPQTVTIKIESFQQPAPIQLSGACLIGTIQLDYDATATASYGNGKNAYTNPANNYVINFDPNYTPGVAAWVLSDGGQPLFSIVSSANLPPNGNNWTNEAPATCAGVLQVGAAGCNTPTAYTVTGGGNACLGGASLSVGLSNSEIGVKYQLYIDGFPIGSVVAGTGAAISFGAQNYDGVYTVGATSLVGGCNAPMTGSVTVQFKPYVTPSVTVAASTSNVISPNTSVTFTATPANGGTTPMYQWQKNGSNVGIDATTYTNATLVDQDVITCILTSNETCVTSPTATSLPIPMTVSTIPKVDIVITVGNQTTCLNRSITFMATPTLGGASPAYQWDKNGTPVGSNSDTYTDETLVDADVITCVLTSNDPGVTTTTATSNAIAMMVNPLPTINSVPSLTVRTNESTLPIGFSGTDAVNFNWTNDNPMIGLPSNGTDDIPAFKATNPTTAPILANITVTPISGFGCVGASTAFTITVEPPFLVPEVTITASGQSICPNTGVTFTATPIYGGTAPSYQWQKNGANVGADSPTYVDDKLVNSDVITCVLTSNDPNANPITGTSNAITMRINALPTVHAVSNQTVRTPNQTTDIAFSGTGDAYTWTNDKPTIGLPASGTGDILAFSTVNATALPIVATITATPVQNTVPELAYIPNSSSNNVSVINVVTGAVVTTIPVGKDPGGVAVSPDGSRVYVANQGSDNISVIDTKTNTVVSTIPNVKAPTGITMSVDSRHLYVMSTDENAIYDIKTATNQVDSIHPSIETPVGIAVHPKGGFFYVGSFGTGDVVVMDTNLQVVTRIATGITPYGLSVSPNGNHLYVSNFLAGEVSVVNTATNEVASKITLGGLVANALVSPDGSRVYAAINNSNQVAVIHTTTNAVISTISVGSDPIGLSLNADGSQLYVVNSGSDNVSVVNTATNVVDATIVVGSEPIGFGNFVKASQAGCVGAPTSFTITVKPPYVTPKVVIAITTGSQTICANTSVTFTARPTYGGDVPIYMWQKNGVNVGTNSTIYTDAALANSDKIQCILKSNHPDALPATAISNAVVMTVNALPAVTVTSPNTAICVGASELFTANASGGNGVYAYKWNDNSTNATLTVSPNATATFSVTVTDGNTCTAMANKSLIVNALPIGSVAGTTDILCNGNASTVTLKATSGLAPYKFSTNGVNYQDSNVFELLAGNYKVNVKDNNGCTSVTTPLVLTQPDVLTISTPMAVPLVCYDSFTDLQSTANGGTTPYEYSLNGFVFQSQNRFSVQGGTYQILVKDKNGCTAKSDLYNLVRPADLVLTTMTNPIKCWGDTTYSTVKVANAVAPIQYKLNGVMQNNDPLYKGLRAGTYPISVVDNRGCAQASTLTIGQPAALVGSVQADTLVCKGKSTPLVVTVSGGTGNIVYNLNAGAFQSDNNFRVTSGTYMPQIRDANLCLKTLPLVKVADATAQLNQLRNIKLNCHETDMRIYPNPVVDILAVDFKISQPAVVKLLVYNALGDLIAKEDYKSIEAGAYTTSWDTANWSANMVRVCLEVDGECVQVTSIMVVH
jgi:YVTN family beta-propeller protein